ncbi:MAG: hypothetical protein WA173_17010 [Pseudomonas sp.]|uniref:hypothetical protein n=1 Tax=Pseudomonas sp. TaxID=306 RepID=UPI003BB770C3
MSFEYVLETLRVCGHPPTDIKFRISQKKYKYYPFLHQGSIITADVDLWDFPSVSDLTDGNANKLYWPSASEIADFFAEQRGQDAWFLIAFSDQPLARTIDPSKTAALSKIQPPLSDIFSKRFSSAGFDVIDASGLSALTNVGYTENDLVTLAGVTIDINQYGLISTPGDSYKFSEFASLAAPEHAPFFPIEVWVFRSGSNGK